MEEALPVGPGSGEEAEEITLAYGGGGGTGAAEVEAL